MNYVGECGTYKCGLCEGDCDDDSDCEGDLVCVERSGFEAVAGCTGEGGSRDMYGKDVCAPSPTPTPPSPTPPTPSPTASTEVEYVGNPCTAEFSSGQCAVCTGDCDSDSDCESGLRCAQRRRFDGLEIVPGCVWGSTRFQMENDDYCEYPLCI